MASTLLEKWNFIENPMYFVRMDCRGIYTPWIAPRISDREHPQEEKV